MRIQLWNFIMKFSCARSILSKMLKCLNLRSQAVTIVKNVYILQIRLQITAHQGPDQGNYPASVQNHYSQRSSGIVEELEMGGNSFKSLNLYKIESDRFSVPQDHIRAS